MVQGVNLLAFVKVTSCRKIDYISHLILQKVLKRCENHSRSLYILFFLYLKLLENFILPFHLRNKLMNNGCPKEFVKDEN